MDSSMFEGENQILALLFISVRRRGHDARQDRSRPSINPDPWLFTAIRDRAMDGRSSRLASSWTTCSSNISQEILTDGSFHIEEDRESVHNS